MCFQNIHRNYSSNQAKEKKYTGNISEKLMGQNQTISSELIISLRLSTISTFMYHGS
jgi:hypothetical protein